jgi:hypothetical protein
MSHLLCTGLSAATPSKVIKGSNGRSNGGANELAELIARDARSRELRNEPLFALSHIDCTPTCNPSAAQMRASFARGISCMS